MRGDLRSSYHPELLPGSTGRGLGGLKECVRSTSRGRFTPRIDREYESAYERKHFSPREIEDFYPTCNLMRSSKSIPDLQEKMRRAERRVYFSRVPTPRKALSKFLRSEVEDMNNKKITEQMEKESYYANPYKVTYYKDAYPLLEKLPPIKFPYSSELLNDYCQMLHPEINNKDVIGFAIHNIDRMKDSKLYVLN